MSDDIERQGRMDHFNAGAVGGEHESSWEAEGRSRVRGLHGKKDIEAVFPSGSSPVTTAPWPGAPRSKTMVPASRDQRVQAELGRDRTVMVDPRIVSATQPGVTHAGLAHYMGKGGRRYEETGETFADTSNRGNQFPVVRTIRNTSPNLPEFSHHLESGHHRALKALLMGEHVRARWVEPE
jgi:hypothetical protein